MNGWNRVGVRVKGWKCGDVEVWRKHEVRWRLQRDAEVERRSSRRVDG